MEKHDLCLKDYSMEASAFLLDAEIKLQKKYRQCRHCSVAYIPNKMPIKKTIGIYLAFKYNSLILWKRAKKSLL